MKVRFAVTPDGARWGNVDLPGFADSLEDLGFDTLWLSDVPMRELVDPLIGLSMAAGRTNRLRLGANVVPLGRNPMILAEQLAQLDQLSDGRLLLSFVPGLDDSGKRAALGIGNANRGRILEEYVHLLRRWWSGERVTAHLDAWRFDDIEVRPLPLQNPLEIVNHDKRPYLSGVWMRFSC